MKMLKNVAAATLALAFLASPVVGLGAEAKEKPKKEAKAKPYPLKVCAVSGEKLGEMGKTYTFTYQGREVKLCCKSCLKDFEKEPAKFVKKMAEAEKSKPATGAKDAHKGGHKKQHAPATEQK